MSIDVAGKNKKNIEKLLKMFKEQKMILSDPAFDTPKTICEFCHPGWTIELKEPFDTICDMHKEEAYQALLTIKKLNFLKND